jgi:hypothetical protein
MNLVLAGCKFRTDCRLDESEFVTFSAGAPQPRQIIHLILIGARKDQQPHLPRTCGILFRDPTLF